MMGSVGEMASSVRIKARLVRDIRRVALAAHPHECCGFLVGRLASDGDCRVTRLVPTVNRAADPARAFEIDPAQQFALLRQLRVLGPGGEVLVGHYHSHPDGPAAPSARDLAAAYDPDMLWIIVGATAAEASPPTAWRPRFVDGVAIDFTRVSLILSEPPSSSPSPSGV